MVIPVGEGAEQKMLKIVKINHNILKDYIINELLELYPELNLTRYLSPIKSNIMDTYIEIIGLFWSRILWPIILALYFYSYNANGYTDFYANCVKSYNYSNDIYISNLYVLLYIFLIILIILYL